MAIPDVSRERILEAMDRFDRDDRGGLPRVNWEQNRAHRYAVQNASQLYPVKKLISIAVGTPVNKFHREREANSYIRARGFDIVRCPSQGQTTVVKSP